MLELRICVSEIKFNIFAQKIFSLMYPSKKPPLWIINRLDKRSTEKFIINIVVKEFKKNKARIIKKLEKSLVENSIPLKITEMYCTGDEKLEIGIVIRDINYTKLFTSIYPLIEKNLKNNKKIGGIFSLYGKDVVKMIRAALTVLPQDKMDEILIYLFNKFSLSFLNKLLKSNQFGVMLKKVSIQKQLSQ